MKGKGRGARSRGREAERERPVAGSGEAEGEDGRWPAWAPHAIFAILTLFLFREFIVSRGMLFGTDVAALGYFARDLYARLVWGAGTFPLWNPYVFGGLPFVDAMHGDIFYPTTLLTAVMPVHRAMGWKLVLHVFLAGVFSYAWLRHLEVSRAIATFGGVAYMLAPVLVSLIHPGHDGKLFVTALTPLALWTTDLAITRGRVWRFAVLALVVALLIYTPHMQLAYFTTWALVVLVVFRLGQAWRAGQARGALLRRFGAFAAAGVAGALLIGALQVWTPVRYLATYSQRVEKTLGAEEARGYAYATSWSLHPEEAFSLVVPEFVGVNVQTAEESANTYWGRNPFKLNHEYAGLLPLLLLPLAFINRGRRGEAWLYTGLAAASLIYGLGATTPLFRVYYWLVPGVRQFFRAPSSIMFIFAIAAVTGAALGLEGLRRYLAGEPDERRDTRKAAIYLWAVTGVLLLLALLGSAGTFTDMWVATLYPEIEAAKRAALNANLGNIRSGLWLSFLISAVVAGAWELRRRGAIPQVGWMAAVIALAALDPLRIDGQFIHVLNPARIYPRDDSTEFLQRQVERESPFRVVVFRTPYQPNQLAFHGIEEAQGHHGNEIGRYRDLIEDVGLTPRLLQILNVRYLVAGTELQGAELPEAYRGRFSIVYELPGILPRAHLVSEFEVLPDSLALRRLFEPGFDPRRAVILDRRPEGELGPEAMGRVEWVERGVNVQSLSVTTSAPALLVVAENYYPAWKATVDGVATPLLRANYSFRAVRVPAGQHEIRFTYRSPLLQAALWTTVLSTLAAVTLIAFPFARRRLVGEPGAPAEPGPGGEETDRPT